MGKKEHTSKSESFFEEYKKKKTIIIINEEKKNASCKFSGLIELFLKRAIIIIMTYHPQVL